MGVMRKLASIQTAGLIDYRSDKERVARSARLTKRNVKKSNRLLAEQNEMLRQQLEKNS